MKHLIRRFNAILTVIGVSIAMLTFFPGVIQAEDEVHYIGVRQPGHGYEYNFDTIQEAVAKSYEAYGAGEFVEIHVYPGEYVVNEESGVIDMRRNKPNITLKKHPSDGECLIQHHYWDDHGKIAVQIGSGEINGFHIVQMDEQQVIGSGIIITSQCVVKNCVVENFNFGIIGFCASNATNQKAPEVIQCETMYCNKGMAVGEMNVVFKRNKIHHNYITGMDFGGGGSPQMFDNFIHHNKFGIYIRSYFCWASMAEISNNVIYKNGYGVYAQHKGYSGEKGQFAICDVIQDNVITENTEWGLYFDDYIPIPQQYDYLIQLRHNNVWKNGGGHDNYYNCPDPIDSISVDPKLMEINGWAYLTEDSPCIDMGSRTLDPGVCVETLDKDIRSIDLGYHQNDKPTPVFESIYTGNTWIVDGDGWRPFDFRSISEALESSRVLDGDILQVRKTRRPYYENLYIEKAVMIEAAKPGADYRPEIVTRLGQPGVEIVAQVKLKHLAIMSSCSGVVSLPGVLARAESCIENCFIAKYNEGIVVDTNYSVRIQYCEVVDNRGTGVTLKGGTAAYLFSNWIGDNGGHGVLVKSSREFDSFPFISNNTIHKNVKDGIRFELMAKGDKGIGGLAINNVIFSNGGFGYTSNQVYSIIDKTGDPITRTFYTDNGIYIQMRNNDIWNNGFSVDPTDVLANFGNKESHHIEYWYCPMPNHSIPHCWLTPRVVNHMSFDPMYDLSTLLLSVDSECIDAGNFKLSPGDAQYMTTDHDMIDIGAHLYVIH